jgi:hypothetical protein
VPYPSKIKGDGLLHRLIAPCGPTVLVKRLTT